MHGVTAINDYNVQSVFLRLGYNDSVFLPSTTIARSSCWFMQWLHAGHKGHVFDNK